MTVFAHTLSDFIQDVDLPKNDANKWSGLRTWLAGELGLDTSGVNATYISDPGMRHQRLGQGGPSSARDLVIAVVPNQGTAKPVAELARTIVGNGQTRALAVVLPRAPGEWTVDSLIGSEDDATLGRLHIEFPDAVILVPLPDTRAQPLSEIAHVAFTRADIDLLAGFATSKQVRDVPEHDRKALQDIRLRLKSLAEAVEAEVTPGWRPFKTLASNWVFSGWIAKELWSCLYPAEVGDKSFGLQIAVILSGRGCEIAFCLGAGQSNAAHEKVDAWKTGLAEAKARLGALEPELVASIETALDDRWRLKRSWTRDPGDSDFASLRDWLEFAASGAGDGASISWYLTAAELEVLGTNVQAAMMETAHVFRPVLDVVYPPSLLAVSEAEPGSGVIVVPTPPSEPSDMAWLQKQTLWTTEALIEVVGAVTTTRQIILAGPPGTGKTWVAKALARHVTDGRPDGVRMVQFHPSYTYEQFIEGLRPVVRQGGIEFQLVDGVVLQMVDAMQDEDERKVLIIDEMNRANLSKVLGELMYLFEYRDDPLDLQYSRSFRLPSQLLFIGTMNTADRSIRSIDIALRRRFDVFECGPDPVVLGRFYEDADHVNTVVDLIEGFVALNDALTKALDRHHTIGHAFFMAPTMTSTLLRAVWRHKIGPLIEEYFFDQPDLAEAFTPVSYWPSIGTK